MSRITDGDFDQMLDELIEETKQVPLAEKPKNKGGRPKGAKNKTNEERMLEALEKRDEAVERQIAQQEKAEKRRAEKKAAEAAKKPPAWRFDPSDIEEFDKQYAVAQWWKGMQEKCNAAFLPLFFVDSRYLVLKGGAGSGKSIFVGQKICERVTTEEGHRVLVCRKVARTLRQSCFAQIVDQLSRYHPDVKVSKNQSDMVIKIEDTGSEILFAGLDDTEKLKSIYNITDVWIEEASEVEESDFLELDRRMRADSKYYKHTLSIAARVIETLGRAADPIFEMSMLDGIMSALDSYESGAQKVSDIAFSAVESYLGQFIPTLFGQLARSVDPVKRSTYSSKDAVLTKTIEQAGRRLIAKIPWASKYLKPVIDRTGKETAQVNTNGFVRVLAQFVSPSNLAFDQFTGVDDELLRLYDLFGETDVLPKSVPSSITNNKQTYNLSSEEYTQYSVILGSQTYTNLETLFASEEYKGMSDEDKKEAAAEIINEAQKEAKASFLDGRGVFNFVRQSTKAEKAEHIRVSSLSDAEKIAQFRSIMTDEQNKVLDELASTGNGWKEIDLLDCYAQYATIDKREDLTANEKRVELAKYITQSAQFNYLTAAQVDKFMNSFGYSSGFKADETSYEKFVKAGLSLKGAESMSNALLALADQEGNTTDAQKFAAISKANATNAEKWTALETLYAKDESLMIDFEAMQQAGASADTYVKTYTKFNEIEKEAKKHKDDDTYEGASYYKYKYLAESGMSAKEIGAIYKNMGGLTNADGIEKLKSLEDAGIGYDVIVQYKYKTALLTADKDKNGKTISGSKKEKVLREINALPITSAQKDALYLYAGYTSKDIRKAPWH